MKVHHTQETPISPCQRRCRAPQAIITYKVRLAEFSNHQRLALAAYRRCNITESVWPARLAIQS